MSKRKGLKAYVRLDKAGQPVAGSMIYRDKKPYGKFVPLVNPSGDVCCPIGCPDPAFWILNIGDGIPGNEGGSFGGFQMFRQVDECTLLAAGNYYDEQAPSPDGMALYKTYLDGTVVSVNKIEDSLFPGPEYYKIDSQGNRIGIASANRIAKWDKNNNILWYKRLYMDQLPNPDMADRFSFTIDANDYIYVSLNMTSNGGPQSESLPIIKLSPDGVIISTNTLKHIPDIGVTYPTISTLDMEVGSNGNIFLLVQTTSYVGFSTFNKAFLLEVDSNLNYITNYRIDTWTGNSYTREFVYYIVKDRDGNFIIPYGYPGSYPYDFDTFEGYVKFNTTTNTVDWANTLFSIPLNRALNLVDIEVDDSNNLFMTTSASLSVLGDTPYEKVVAKMDASGVLQWAYKISSTIEPYGLNDMWTNQFKTSSLTGDSFLSCSYGNYYGQLYRLPLTPVTGTYGTFVFTDITNTLTQTTTTFPVVQEDFELLARTYGSEDLPFNKVTITTEQTLYNI